MPSQRSQKTLGLIRAHKRTASAIGRSWIMRLDPTAKSVARLRMVGTRAKTIDTLGMPAVMILPQHIAVDDAAILHMHGGAYVSGGILQSRAIASPICAAAQIRTLTFSYRLAPRDPYPAQLEDAYRAYCYLREQGFAPGKIAFMGESAGGNLALSLAAKLRDAGEEMPAAIALMSPWVDLAQTGDSYERLVDVDATLDAENLMESAIAFAGSPSRFMDGDISPLYADFTGFPPIQIHCGTHEILLSDSERLEEALQRDGVQAQLFRWVGMCHVFQAFGFEESRASIHQIGQFLHEHLKKQPMPDEKASKS
ncbi:MAG: alpha/beta hydrolase [Clostridia bacterium]|nr:alpha/beta hydrolase [Clostridia bacterium]